MKNYYRKEKNEEESRREDQIKRCFSSGILEEKVLQKWLLWWCKVSKQLWLGGSSSSFEVSSTINEDLSWSIIQLPARH